METHGTQWFRRNPIRCAVGREQVLIHRPSTCEVGQPLAGELAGMAGGRMIIRGAVGARAGDRLRRGVIVIEGAAGEDLGSRLIAGTIVALGDLAGRIGYLNRRGSLILARSTTPGPTYLDCGGHILTYAGLLARSLRQDSPQAAALLGRKLRRFGGDTAVHGKGEILTPM